MNKRRYILIVEDSASQALRLQLLLKRAGYDVSIVRDGAEGWQQACSEQPGMILLDINLPTMDGFEVLSRLKTSGSTAAIPIVMLTSLDRIHDVEEAVARGADGYLFKDDCLGRHDGFRQVIDAVEQCLSVVRCDAA